MESPNSGARAALTLEVSGEGVAWLVFDRPDSRVNLLTSAVMRRLDELLGEIETRVARGSVSAVVIRSGKPDTFVAGADIHEILSVDSPEAGEAAARAGQRVFRRLELLRVPTVAAVDGICLGGGTELILSCGYRIASDRPQTRIGLPEVRLGIIPGFGGTTRLPRLIGLKNALPLILTGKSISAKRAERIELIDEAVPAPLLYWRAEELALSAVGRPLRARRRRPLASRLMEEAAPARAAILAQARRQVLKETRGHYPAPLVALDTIAQGFPAPLERAFELEARALGRLIATDVSRNLIHVFLLLEAAKKAGPAGVEPRPVRRAGVLGAGIMGGGIAQLLASRDVPVRLKDIRTDAIAQGLAHARRLFDREVRRRRISRREATRFMELISPTLEYTGFRPADLVIEAVVERIDVKKNVLREVESRARAGCVLTSNTSSLSITEMQNVLERPEDFCGMHFFNPVHRMPLVEVVRGERTGDAAVATVVALVRKLDKTPVIVRDGPGFLVNRVLAPYLNEAGWLLAEGAPIERIDRVLLEFGMPMGPLRLLDEIGLDIARHAGAVLRDAFGDRLEAPRIFGVLAESGWLGRKSGRGFYVYEKDEQTGVNDQLYDRLGERSVSDDHVEDDEILARTVLVMINEAARVLADGIVRGAGDVDVAMITGTGFPPFRGGLLRYADTLGVATVVERLDALAASRGARFEPAPLLRDLAASGRGFYD